MKKPVFKHKLYWLISALAFMLLIFLGYSEIKFSGNRVSVSIPGQKDSMQLDLPDYFLSDSAVPSQANDGKDSSKEKRSPSYKVEINDVLPDSSLFYPPHSIPKRADSENSKTATNQEADGKDSGTTDAVTVNVVDENSLLPTQADIFWINFYLNTSSEEDNGSSVASRTPGSNNLNNVDYTRVGSGNRLDQVRVNGIYNTQRITQVGRNNYANQTLINTINSEFTVRSTGDYNTVIQKAYNANNSRITAIQNGFLNKIRQEVNSNGIWGTFDRTINEVRQSGYNNMVRTQQFGVSNTIQAVQNGSLNTVDISQRGSNNSATVRQSGSGNSVTIEQH